MSNMDIIFMSYVEQNLDVQEDHFPAFGFKGGEESSSKGGQNFDLYSWL